MSGIKEVPGFCCCFFDTDLRRFQSKRRGQEKGKINATKERKMAGLALCGAGSSSSGMRLGREWSGRRPAGCGLRWCEETWSKWRLTNFTYSDQVINLADSLILEKVGQYLQGRLV